MSKARKETQVRKVLQWLENGERVTSMDAFRREGITRLSSCIFDLRKKGYNIKTVRGEGNYGIYYLKEER